MEQAIMTKRSETHKKKGIVVQKAIVPTICFAALSTITLQKEVFAAQNLTQVQTSQGTQKYVNISSGSLNLRAGASTGAAIIATLSKGTALTVYSEANGWAKVNANGKDGYVSSNYLSATNPTTYFNASLTMPSTTKYVNISSGSLNMRNSPSASASIIVKLAKGASVRVYSEANGWSKIVAYGQTGYVSTQFLNDAVQSSPPSTTAVQKPITEYVNVSSDSSLNLRLSNSLSSTVLAKLANGTEVQVLSTVNGWAKVQVSGKEGYVSSDLLTETKPIMNPQSDPVAVTKYVNVILGSSLNMRKSPSANSSIIVKIARGVQVTVLSESNGWAHIEAYGQNGYVSSEFLSTANPVAGNDTNSSSDNPTTDTATTLADNSGTGISTGNSSDNTSNAAVIKYVNVIFGASLNMRSSPSTSASIITKLARGTAVTVVSEETDWTRITANAEEGYVSSQYLSATAPFNPAQSNSSADITYENYGISLSDMEKIQMAVNPQTDKKYNTYIRSDALTLTSPTSGTVIGSGWNVRGGAGTNFWVVGQVSNCDSFQIISKVKGSDGYDWYQINYNKTWVNAGPDDVAYYLDPNNFVHSSVESLQFLKLSVSANLDAAEVNNRILNGKGILQGQADAFISAGKTYGINEIYLISHALLETGNGTSQLAKGVNINGKTVYNMFGIGAFDSNPVSSGAQFAYNSGWFTKEAAIIGGAQFIANGYINVGQDTLYKMKWNPGSAEANGYASHQYATDIGWASKQVQQFFNLYNLLDSYSLVLDIPKYQ